MKLTNMQRQGLHKDISKNKYLLFLHSFIFSFFNMLYVSWFFKCAWIFHPKLLLEIFGKSCPQLHRHGGWLCVRADLELGHPYFCHVPLLGLAQYNDQASTNKCAWLNEQHELLMSTNRWALKHIKQSAKKSQTRAGGKTLHIPVGNLVLLEIILRVTSKFRTTISPSYSLLLITIRTPMCTLYNH